MCHQDKTSPGSCGCGVADSDANSNGIPDCDDATIGDSYPHSTCSSSDCPGTTDATCRALTDDASCSSFLSGTMVCPVATESCSPLPPLAELGGAACVECLGGVGPCQDADGFCFEYALEAQQQCPVGTLPCHPQTAADVASDYEDSFALLS